MDVANKDYIERDGQRYDMAYVEHEWGRLAERLGPGAKRFGTVLWGSVPWLAAQRVSDGTVLYVNTVGTIKTAKARMSASFKEDE